MASGEEPVRDGRSRFAAAGIEIVERDRGTIQALIHTAAGPVTFVVNLILIEDRLILDAAHVSGEGLTIARICQLAKVLAEVEDENVVEVIIQGGARSSGARPGSNPTPMRVKVRS